MPGRAEIRGVGTKIDLTIVLDDAEVQRLLQMAIARSKNLTVALKRFASYMYGRIGRTFRDEGLPGPKWKPLSPVTLALRRKGKAGNLGRVRQAVRQAWADMPTAAPTVGVKILQDTGRLKASITGARAKGAIYKVRPSSLEIGTRVKYSVIHQRGRPRLPGVKVRVPKHPRRAYTRIVKGVVQKVRATTVKAHTKTTTLPKVPARPFLFFSRGDIKVAIYTLRKAVLGY